MRALPVRGKLRCESLDREGFARLSSGIVRQEISLPTLGYEAVALKDLGIIEQDFDYQGCLVDLLTSNAAAFYSAERKALVLPAWIKVPQYLVAHEVTHALQDQHYGLKTLSPYKFIFSDKSLAVGGLLEGDAMRVERKFIESNPTYAKEDLDLADKLAPHNTACVMPADLQALFDAPYDYGQVFVNSLIDDGGQQSLMTLFGRVPASTEQLLHAKKYMDNEVPTPSEILLPDKMMVAGGTFKRVFVDSIGELGIRLLFKKYLSRAESVLAAKDWGNDRFGLYVDREKRTSFLIWRTYWDSQTAADRFRRAVLGAWSVRLGMSLNFDAPGVLLLAEGPQSFALRARAANEVLVLVSHGDLRTFSELLRAYPATH